MVVALVLALFATPGRVAACSCAPLTDAEARGFADAVFVGTLAEVITPPGPSYSSADPERFVFEVDGVYLGDVFARQSVVTARDGASCGLEISGPGPFLVFARTPDTSTGEALEGELTSSLCSGTRTLADGGAPVEFGEPSPPTPGASPVGSESSGFPIVLVSATVAALVVVAAGAVLIIRSRPARGRPAPESGTP